MATVVILGDPHIGKSASLGKVSIGSIVNSRVVDQSNLLDWTLEQAINVGARHIIVTGDVFEEPKPLPSLITLYVSWLKKCGANGIHVHTIMGNHDILRTGNYYTSPLDIILECDLDHVSIYKEIDTIFIGSTAFTFMPFRDRKSFNVASNPEALNLLKNTLTYELASIPKTYRKVLVGHLAIEGSIPVGDEIDDLNNEIFCPIDMFKGYDYVWMGHVHKPQIMTKGNNNNPYVAHVGSMDISNFGETDHKKHIIVFDADRDKNKMSMFDRIDLPTRPLKKITISVPKGTKDTTQYVVDEITKNNSDIKKAIIRLEVHLTDPELLPINRSVVEKYFYTSGVFNVAAISESKKLSLVKKDENNVINTTMDVSEAIKAYASSYIIDEKRSSFTELSLEIFNQFKAESKN